MSIFKLHPKIDWIKHKYLNWWLYSYPPLSGWLRFFVYMALLLSAVLQSNKSPVRGIWYYETTDPALFKTYGLVKLLQIPYIAPEHLRIVIMVVIVAWFCAAIGLFSRWASIITAVGVFFLHGIFFNSNAFNHNWFLPMYALIALCFARTSDRWSVDYYLNKFWQRKRERPTLADTGFARQLFLVLAVGFYFAAGVSKLYNAGFAWANGQSIQYFAEGYAVFPLGPILANSLWLSGLSAIISLGFEVGATAALFSYKARFIVVLGWVAMHVGIRYSLGPKYIQNVICLTLLVDWGVATAMVRRGLRTLRKKLISKRLSAPRVERSIPVSERTYSVRGTIAAITFGTCTLILMGAIALGQIFWWPFTPVYMYSNNYSKVEDLRADLPRLDYYNPVKVQQIARDFLNTSTTVESTQYLAYRVCLRLVSSDQEPLYLFDATESYSVGVPEWKQFILTVIRPVLIADLASKPANQLEFNPDLPEYPAQKFLTQYAPILRRHVAPEIWQQYDRVELVYPIVESNKKVGDREPIPAAVWQHYRESGDEFVPIPEARFVAIAAIAIDKHSKANNNRSRHSILK
ncbi:MAG: hypothetical protein AAGK10_18980 [Cyanobacteria bacterium J06555_3]